ncbi:Fic family protein [Halorubrum sp. Atlit-26R]|uniref:Fic family protein n=1 Tax=Halorubrum sp. Atlit-26R TaxID=2282128 RepID=UPI001F429F19|nr:Fic family protein [Halorubrum sp. Atlit-26R]
MLLDQLIAYNRMENYPSLIDIVLSHYQVETIHPFRDGNGRLGRLLIMLQLYDAGLLDEPYLYLSAYFNRNRSEYFEELLSVSRDGTWEEWVVGVIADLQPQAQSNALVVELAFEGVDVPVFLHEASALVIFAGWILLPFAAGYYRFREADLT